MCMHVDDHHVVYIMHFSRYYIFCVVVREALQLLKVPHLLMWQQEMEQHLMQALALSLQCMEMFYNSANAPFIMHANSS